MCHVRCLVDQRHVAVGAVMICIQHLARLDTEQEVDLSKYPAAITVIRGNALCLECVVKQVREYAVSLGVT